MPSINIPQMAASSRMAGLKNYKPNGTGSLFIPATGLDAGQYAKFSVTIPILRSSAVTSFRVRLTGIESFWRQIHGYAQIDKPNLAAWDYSVQIQGYYQGSNFICDVYLINQAGFFITTPAFTLDIILNLFVAPF